MAAQLSVANPTADPENRYYWRMNPKRMEAEVVRDSLLHLAGELDPRAGGPPIDLGQSDVSRRRSLYFVHSHNDEHKFLATFDSAGVLECYRRAESIVPQQALALENSKLALGMAARIADRMNEPEDGAFVRAAFEIILASTPTAAEQTECLRAMRQLAKIGTPQRARMALVHALLNHNDFITVR